MRAQGRDPGTPDILKRKIKEAADKLGDSMDAATIRPDGTSAYGQAREGYRVSHEYTEAREKGQNLLAKSERSDELAIAVRKMTPEQKRGVAEGMHDAITQDLENVRSSREATTASSILTKDAVNAKLKVLENAGVLTAGAADDLRKLAKGVERETGLYNKVMNNSVTGTIMEAGKDVPDPRAPVVPESVKSTTVPGALAAVGYTVADKVFGWGTRRGRLENNIDAARALVSGGGGTLDRQALLQKLQDEYKGSKGGYFRGPINSPIAKGAIAGAQQSNENHRPLVVTVRPPRR
jgi:hypothetical protein